MKISMRGDYAVRALEDLAERYGQGPIPSSDIAARQYIPEPYLDQLMTLLRKGGFVNSRRGPQGGHVLARAPHEIRLSEVITALEGSLATIGCLDDTIRCVLSGRCGQQEVWHQITELTHNVLTATRLSDLVERQKQLEAKVMYYI